MSVPENQSFGVCVRVLLHRAMQQPTCILPAFDVVQWDGASREEDDEGWGWHCVT